MTEQMVGPQIDGLNFLEHLGTGGYSNVFLYEQHKPRMRVAVKVLTDTRLTETELAQFAAEAETMAELAAHPFIVQVFRTGVTGDGRPYLIMKYYPPPNLGQRAATERFTVAEVLRTGIQIASAVETAHRAGIVHRDIKPANILVSQYGEPGLADFGIAGRSAETDDDDDLGVSIPWSPPEVLSGASNGSVASDVYSMAATFWHLLAGRSPFEILGGDNSSRALMGRVLRSAPPATGRADVPASLERLLQQAMSKQPARRPASALGFARSLQMIEQELRYARTEIVVDDTAPAAPRIVEPVGPTPNPRTATPADNAHFAPAQPAPEDSPPTSVRPARPTGPVQAPVTRPPLAEVATTARPARPTDPAERRSVWEARPAENEGTRARPSGPKPPPVAPPERHRAGLIAQAPATTRRPQAPSATDNAVTPDSVAVPRRGVKASLVVLAIAVAVVVAIVIGGIVAMSGNSEHPVTGDSPKPPVGTDQGNFGGGDLEPPVVTATYDSSRHVVTFAWTPATTAVPTGKYVYSFADGKPPVTTTHTTVRVSTKTPESVCITVGVVAADGTSRLAQPVCGR